MELDADGEPLTAERLRKRGLRREREGQISRRYGNSSGERSLRAALADLVNAFLTDRRGHSDLFARAHQLGMELSLSGCSFEYDGEKRAYALRCPIFALHRPVAHSVSWTLLTECSICGAGAFECDHLAGREYDDAVCEVKATKIANFGHVAWTADPDFLYTWHQPQHFDADKLLDEGRIEHAGQKAFCTHCQDCGGWVGPSDGDLDPVTRWEKIVSDNLASEGAGTSEGSA